MSIDTPAKRPRTSDASPRSHKRVARKHLSTQQRQSLRHAHFLENGIDVAEQLQRLRHGQADLDQIDWSSQNLIATASGSSNSASTSSAASAHVIVRYPVPQSSKHSLRPCHLYPHQPYFSVTPVAGPSQPHTPPPGSQPPGVHYDDPRHIAFSPCGFYLCAYFPALPANTPPSSLNPALPSMPADAPLGHNSAGPMAASASATSIPMINQLSGAAPPLDASLAASTNSAVAQTTAPAAAASPGSASEPSGVICIWSRAETGALNDWKLVDSIPVNNIQHPAPSATAGKADNVLKVNDKGQQIIKDGSRTSPPIKDGVHLHAGVAKVVWLNQRRRVVLPTASSATSHYGSAPFERLSSRGPTCVPSAAAPNDEAGPDKDLALVVFGQHGQVTLLCRRSADTNDSSIDTAKARTKFFTTVLQSDLHTPRVQPSPITLDSSTGTERPDGVGSAYASLFAGDADGLDEGMQYGHDARISHLAVGMPANEPVLLVASKRVSTSAGLVGLAEVTVDLRADAVTMTTRPLQPISLAPVEHPASSDVSTAEPAAGPCDDALTLLTWAEVDGKEASSAAAGRTDSLRLVAGWSHLDEDRGDDKEAALGMHSNLAVWDVYKAETELSEAFASLECRKAGQAPAWLDWQLRFGAAKTLRGQLVTSLVTPHALVGANTAILTSLSATPARPGLLSEQLAMVDLHTLEVAQHVPVPPRALLRCSRPVVSANGALIGVFAHAHTGATPAIVMWKLPWHSLKPGTDDATKQSNESEEDRARLVQLLALSCVRGSDASDISRVYSASAGGDDAKLLVDVGDVLKITDSKRQDVLVKIEGATAKGPSHDTNSIPLHQALRLLKIRMAIGSASANVQLQRLVLELGLCYQVLRLARVATQVPTTPKDDGKKKGKPAGGEMRPRVYYRLESVWPLLAQLQWLLGLLDGVSKLSLATAAAGTEGKEGTREEVSEEQFVRMLGKPTPRRLVLHIVAHVVDFIQWVDSTVRHENLPPPTGASVGDELTFLANAATRGVLAVSEQMALAREALAHITRSASIDLTDFAHLLAGIEADSSGAPTGRARETDRFWWATLAGGSLGEAEAKADEAVPSKLLALMGDAQGGALVDVLPLFVVPADITDERSVLYDTSADDAHAASPLVEALGAMAAKRDSQRDIMRKTTLRSAVTQTAIINDSAAIIRSSAGRTATSEGEVRVDLMRAKRCVRCGALSQDSVHAVYTMSAPQPLPNGMVLDATMPANVQMQMQMQMHMHMVQAGLTAPPTISPLPPPALVGIEAPDTRARVCLCGGAWWVL